MIIRNSMITDLFSCPWKFMIRWRKKIVPEVEKEYFSIGKLFHAYAAYCVANDNFDNFDALIKIAENYDGADKEEGIALADSMMSQGSETIQAIIKQWKQDGAEIFVEKTLYTLISNSGFSALTEKEALEKNEQDPDCLIYRCTIDLLAVFPKYCNIIDWKTSSGIASSEEYNLFSPQLALYSIASATHYKPVERARYGFFLSKVPERPKLIKNGKRLHINNPPTTERVFDLFCDENPHVREDPNFDETRSRALKHTFFKISDYNLEQNYQIACDRLVNAYNVLQNNIMYKNLNYHCTRGCPYIDICKTFDDIEDYQEFVALGYRSIAEKEEMTHEKI